MLAETRTGPIVSSDGSTNVTRATRTGALVVSDAHGRYTEGCARGGNFFTAANSAVQALSLNSVTATGIVLTNPPGSGKVLSLIGVNVSIASLPAGQYSLILAGATSATLGAVTHTTPLTVRGAYIGGAQQLTSVALVDSAATLPAGGNTIIDVLGGGGAATMATSTAYPPFIAYEVAGRITLAPGAFISLQCLTTAVTVLASIQWEEITL